MALEILFEKEVQKKVESLNDKDLQSLTKLCD